MSLVPYSSRDSREIVLRHDDAIVIRDPQTQQLILRGASSFNECPTCHQSLRSSPKERNPSPQRPPVRPTAFISPEYFRMLQAANGRVDEHIPPSSPIRRLVEPAFLTQGGSGSRGSSVEEGAEFVASSPAPSGAGHSIKREAFSPNYFKRFFTEEKELGRGGKGVVLLVRHELDRVSLGQFACKRVPVGDNHAWLEKVLIEVQLLQGLSHPNLVSYRHVWLEDAKPNNFGPPVPCAFILQQYCNSGDLLRYVIGDGPLINETKEHLKEQMRRRSRGQLETPGDLQGNQRKLSFEEIYSFFKDITSGLAHLHGANYIHRDLKPSNCLLHKDGNDLRCLISDFGEVQPENVMRKSTGSTGTISYCAPEVLKQDKFGNYGNFTTKSDIFSLGMILYFMCFGRLPYRSADSVNEELEDIDLLRAEISTWSGFQDERRERPELPGQLYSFLKRLLALNPADRPSAAEILDAIRSEKGLENPPRPRNGNISGLGSGRIIQSLDSPMQPGTPSNGLFSPQDHSVRGVSPRVEPNLRSNSTTYLEDGTSLERSPGISNSELEHSPTHHSGSHEGSRLKVHPTTPLLMPPPSTRLSTLKHGLSLQQHYFRTWARRNQQPLHLVARLVLFLFKTLSISKPCTPLAARESIWYPLMSLAALDLAAGSRIGPRVAGGLAVFHLVVLWWAVRWSAGGLCASRGGDGDWLSWVDM